MNHLKETTPLISIIIPVYKVEQYLEKCMASILGQTYDNLEVILVDDGSPDGCPKMCDTYGKRYQNVIVIHKKNGGLSSARNAGVRVATGEYIAFVDSDDYVDPKMYEHMVNVMLCQKSDMVICGLQCVDEQNQEINAGRTLLTGQLDPDSIALKILDGWWEYVPAWNKLYKAEVIKSYLFPEGKIHEDEFTVHHYLGACKSISVIPEKYYKYVIRNGSIVHSGISVKSFDALDAYYDRYKYYEKARKNFLAKKTFEVIESVYCDRRYNIKVTEDNRIAVKEIDQRFCEYFLKKSSHSFLWKTVFNISPQGYSIFFKIKRRIMLLAFFQKRGAK